MDFKPSHLSLAIFIICLAGACDRPDCKNANPVFDRFGPDAREYKAELARQIRNKSADKLSYWFDYYLEKDAQTFIVLNIQGGKVCAKGEVIVNQWNKMEGIKRTKGLGYHGAELRGFKMDIEEDSSGTHFVYRDLDRIND